MERVNPNPNPEVLLGVFASLHKKFRTRQVEECSGTLFPSENSWFGLLPNQYSKY